MKLDLGTEPHYDRFCKSCNLMYKSKWKKNHLCNHITIKYSTFKPNPTTGQLEEWYGWTSRMLFSFEDSAIKLNYKIIFAKRLKDENAEKFTKEFEELLKKPTKKVYVDVPPLTEPAIKISREFHEEFLEYRKKYLESND